MNTAEALAELARWLPADRDYDDPHQRAVRTVVEAEHVPAPSVDLRPVDPFADVTIEPTQRIPLTEQWWRSLPEDSRNAIAEMLG